MRPDVAAAGEGGDALAVARRSPEIVLAKDRDAWLALFTEPASIEDPVGAGAHVGPEARARFWEVFIAPQREISFTARRDFARPGHAIRYVTIATLTPVSDEPFTLPAIVEYRVDEGRIASLRAFWEPKNAVTWHAKQGAKGLGGLLKHSLRTTTGLGVGAATRFGLAMRPGVRAADARRLAEALGRAHGGARAEWKALVGDAALTVAEPSGGLVTDADAAFDRALEGAPRLAPEEVIVAGDHVATVLVGDGLAVAALARVERGRIRALTCLRQV